MTVDPSKAAHEHASALRLQAKQCGALGSPMYEVLFGELAVLCTPGSRLADMLGRSERSVHDALPLRLAGSVHGCVLRGEAPTSLSHHYPTAGGSPLPSYTADFLSFVYANEGVVKDGLQTMVQTNEVRRGIVVRELTYWLASLSIKEFDLLEVGASAGLNLLFDHYPDSWFTETAKISRPATLSQREPSTVRHRLGCDPAPIDPRDNESVTRLLSFVWPDQTDRQQRLAQALRIAREFPVDVVRASADEWLRGVLQPREVATVVFHSIVWQYLDPEVQRKMRAELTHYGTRASRSAPLFWLRMEPNGAMADVRATVWQGGAAATERVLADVGYHGEPFIWRI